ncbi:MAG: gamma-glutamyltransferase [Pseudomonadota bacterium]
MASAEAGVAAGHALTAEAGAAILRDGGTAVDAAIAALLMACVCEPVLASPGGGGFATLIVDGQPAVLDFFVAAPGHKSAIEHLDFREVHADFGTTTQGFHIGAGAVAIPGFLPGLFSLHQRFGRVPFKTLAEPAVTAAKDGVVVTGFQAFLADVVSPILLASPDAQRLFGDGSGATLKEGVLFCNPELADALDAIANDGVRIATEGEIAAALLSISEAPAGHVRAQDLAGYEPIWRTPLAMPLGEGMFFTNPPPSLGGSLAAMMLDHYQLASQSTANDDGRFLRRAGAIDECDRFWRQAPEDAARIAAKVDSQWRNGDNHSGGSAISSRGTTHISIIDRAGNAVAATVSNGEGNGSLVPGCGFMPNNMLGEEDVNPRGFHHWQPDARLASMMAPSLHVQRDGGTLVLGSGGSNRIRTAVFQVMASHVLDNLPIDEAVEEPRLHAEKGFLDIEGGVPEGVSAALQSEFPENRIWDDRSLYFGGVHALSRTGSGALSGAGDPRRAGVVVRV